MLNEKAVAREAGTRKCVRNPDPNAVLAVALCSMAQHSAMVSPLFNPGPGGNLPPAAYRGIMADLLRRVAERADPAAFRELYDAYGPRVKAYMMRKGADAGTAEDLAQETLLTVWRKASLYADDKGSMTTWVFTIARNLRIDRLRREVPWQELPEWRLAEPSEEALPDAALAEKQEQAQLHAALVDLPPRSEAKSCRSLTSKVCRTARLQRAWRCRWAPSNHGCASRTRRFAPPSRTSNDHHASPRRRDLDELRCRLAAQCARRGCRCPRRDVPALPA